MTFETYHHHPTQNAECEAAARENHHGSTGPRTPEGKAISSQNATRHGCRSKTLILRHEDPAEYEALHKRWWDHYRPSGQAEETLVQQLIDNDWFLLRAEHRMEQVDFEMPADVHSWTGDQQKLFNNFQRYKTAAERAFRKSFRAIERHLHDCRRDQIAAEKAELMRTKIDAQLKKLAPKPEPAATQDPPRQRTPLAEIKARMHSVQAFALYRSSLR